MDVNQKREQELATIRFMISLYCKKQHHQKDGLCDECEDLYAYAKKRIELCPFMETKSFCSACKVHCYQKEKRDAIRNIMRFSGPRMLMYHPVMAIRHVIETMKGKRKQ